MLPALKSLATNPRLPPYESVFFHDKIKFQYPLTSFYLSIYCSASE